MELILGAIPRDPLPGALEFGKERRMKMGQWSEFLGPVG